MWPILLLSTVTFAFASLPLAMSRRHSLLSPATYVWLMVLWSVFAKSWYMLLFHPQRLDGIDKIFKAGTSVDYFVVGAGMALAAVSAYVLGFVLTPGKIDLLQRVPSWSARRPSLKWSYGALFGLLGVSVAAFVAYLALSGNSLLEGPLSTKRFQWTELGVESRFHYAPYYFFKLAMISGSVALASALLLFRSSQGEPSRVYRLAFTLSFAFTLFLAYFASLRMMILTALMAVFLFAIKAKRRRELAFLTLVAATTVAGLALITFVHRPPSDETVAELAGLQTAAQNHLAGSKMGPGESAFGGRYFLDFTKLSYIAHHVPEQSAYMMGRAWLGEPMRSNGSEHSPGRYLAEVIYGEEGNSVPPGFAGELYLNFGWLGVVGGFFLLGAFHRVIFKTLRRDRLPMLMEGALVISIPATTLVLVNSGLIPAISRFVIDAGILVLICAPSLQKMAPRSGE